MLMRSTFSRLMSDKMPLEMLCLLLPSNASMTKPRGRVSACLLLDARKRAWEADNIVLFPFPMCVAVTPVHRYICSLPLSSSISPSSSSSVGSKAPVRVWKRTGMRSSYEWGSWAVWLFDGGVDKNRCQELCSFAGRAIAVLEGPVARDRRPKNI